MPWVGMPAGVTIPGELPIKDAVVMLYAGANNNGIIDVIDGGYQIAVALTDAGGSGQTPNLTNSSGPVVVRDLLASGNNLVGGGYPVAQPATWAGSRRMDPAHGFLGRASVATADTFSVWKGDATLGATDCDDWYLCTPPAAGAKWVGKGDATLTSRNAERLLLGDRAVFIRVQVCSDLTTWREGSEFTEVVSGDPAALVVRDLTPLGGGAPKRKCRRPRSGPERGHPPQCCRYSAGSGHGRPRAGCPIRFTWSLHPEGSPQQQRAAHRNFRVVLRQAVELGESGRVGELASGNGGGIAGVGGIVEIADGFEEDR
jgi:hypothetical protein